MLKFNLKFWLLPLFIPLHFQSYSLVLSNLILWKDHFWNALKKSLKKSKERIERNTLESTIKIIAIFGQCVFDTPLHDLISFKGGTEPYTSRGGLWPPPIFFKKILNNRYIFKILENKSMKNYICPFKENYICPLRLWILVPSLFQSYGRNKRMSLEREYYYVWCTTLLSSMVWK